MPEAAHCLPFLLQQDGGAMLPQMVILILPLFLIWYFLLIRPQSKERKLQEQIRSELKKGDKVLTQSGVIAKIHSVGDAEVVLNLDGTARMRVLKETIVRRLEEDKERGKGSSSQKTQAAGAS